MNKILTIIIALLVVFSCKSPDARKPISVKTGSFIDASVERNKKLSRLSSDKARVSHVIKFAKSNQLTFQEIDEPFLKRFKLYLRTKRLISERSIVNNLVVIRTIYNRAIKMGIVDQKLYPFGSDKIRIKI